jgi:competence protein CoiA
LLIAKNQTGETVYIGDLKQKEGLRGCKDDQYYCPLCNGKVMVKLGVQRISHFAHVQLSPTCAEYERETEYHLQAKKQLYHWVKKQCPNVELEVFLPELKQRPDLMFTFQGRTYCLEYQCSPISEEVFEKRTNGYVRNGLSPLWILGANRIQRKQTNQITVSKFQCLFLKRNHTGAWYIPSYCPSLNTFITITNLNPLSSNTMQCDYNFIPPSKQHLPHWLNPFYQNTFYVSNWRKEVQRVKNNIIRFHKPKHFLQELYMKQLHPHLLPPYVGVPLRDNLLLETSPIIWQMYVLLDNLFMSKEASILTKDNVYKRLIIRIKRNHIKVRRHLKPSDSQMMALIKEYLFLLTKCQILKEISPNVYRYENSVVMPCSMNEASKFEEQFYKQMTNEQIVWY